MLKTQLLAIFFATTIALPAIATADPLDDYVKTEMQRRGVPGLSLAVVNEGKIVEIRCYGVVESGTRRKVTPSTLFQAGSISKTVSAVGALRLVEQGLLSLDEDVNLKLRSWKVPENKFTKTQKVTLRRLLSHTAGMTVHGFPGYATDALMPTLVQVLNGEKPANTPAIVVDTQPGTIWRYSGGGYTVMQQLVLDATDRPFPEFMSKTVLGPAGMTQSSFDQPQPKNRAPRTAAGTYPDGSIVKGRWHLYPEMAAAGLWTTPTDLAKFVISIQRSYAGDPSGVLSKSTAQQMLTDQKQGDGLGTFLAGKDETLWFSHSGRDEGFDALYLGYAKTGQGVVVMINANENSDMVGRIVKFIAGQYNWPGYPRLQTPPKFQRAHIEAKRLDTLSGYYTLDQQTLSLSKAQGGLQLRDANSLVDDLVPQGKDTFVSLDIERMISASTLTSDSVTEFRLTDLKGQNPERLSRICGLLSTHPIEKDPDPARTAQVQSFFAALQSGGDPIANSPYLSLGARKDFRQGAPDFNGLQSSEYIGEDAVSSEFSRHGSKVSRVLEYRIKQSGRTRYVIVFLTDNALITDFDVVNL